MAIRIHYSYWNERECKRIPCAREYETDRLDEAKREFWQAYKNVSYMKYLEIDKTELFIPGFWVEIK